MTKGKHHEMFGAVSWAGEVGGQPAVVTAYRNGASVWLYEKPWWKKGRWVRIEFKTTESALAAAGAEEE